MSFLDKLANGLAIAFIQQYNPCRCKYFLCFSKYDYHSFFSTCSSCCPLFYRQILSFIPGFITICTLLILINIGGVHNSIRSMDLLRQSMISLWYRIIQRTLKLILTKIV